jgi:hypothetical protein
VSDTNAARRPTPSASIALPHTSRARRHDRKWPKPGHVRRSFVIGTAGPPTTNEVRICRCWRSAAASLPGRPRTSARSFGGPKAQSHVRTSRATNLIRICHRSSGLEAPRSISKSLRDLEHRPFAERPGEVGCPSSGCSDRPRRGSVDGPWTAPPDSAHLPRNSWISP